MITFSGKNHNSKFQYASVQSVSLRVGVVVSSVLQLLVSFSLCLFASKESHKNKGELSQLFGQSVTNDTSPIV